MITFNFSKIAYPAWMDIAQCLYEREDRWAEAGSPAHGFTTMLPDFRTCLYCGKPADSVAHNVAAQAAAYAPTTPMLAALAGRGTSCTPGDRCVPGGPGVGYTCDAHLPTASLAERVAGLPGLAEQVHGIRLDADTVAIAGETYIRRPF